MTRPATVSAMREVDVEVLRTHLTFLRRCDARPATIRGRTGVVRRLSAGLPCPLLEASADDVWEWVEQCRTRLTNASVRNYVSHAKAFYRWARQHGAITVDPTLDLRTPRVPMGRARPISEDSLRLAIRCAPQPVRTWLILAGFCGLRAGEIARLRAEDIHDEVLDVDGKAGKPRVVPLPTDVRGALLQHVTGPGVVWRTATGAPISADRVSHLCCAHLRSTGSASTLHKLRHRYATRLYELSRDPMLVKDLLGHASLATTQVYLGVSAARARVVTDQLAETLGAARRDDDPPGTGIPVPA